MERADISQIAELKATSIGGGAYYMTGGDKWKPPQQPLRHYVLEGYQANPIIYRSVNEIAIGASKIEIELFKGDKRVDSHPLLDLLKRPNEAQSFDDFISELIISDRIFGEQFIMATSEKKPKELWLYDPQEMEVEKSKVRGLPDGYRQKAGGKVVQTFTPEEMLMRKRHNPADCWRGQSPLMAVGKQGDTFNEGAKWNYGLLRNSAAPSGVLTFKGAVPAPEVASKVVQTFKNLFSGSNRAGEVAMLGDEAKWVPLSHSPKDMDFSTTMDKASKYIASTLGVPLPLVDNDASTFNNLEQAKERLYTDTIIPLVSEAITSFNQWLCPKFDDGLELRLNMDSIPALEGLRSRRYQRAIDGYNAGLITLEEARELMGYGAEPDGDLRPFTVPVPQGDVKSKMIEEAKNA